MSIKRNQWQPEPGRHIHQSKCFAIPFRPRHAEVPEYFCLGIPTLLLSNEHDRPAPEPGHAADDSMVVGESPVTVQFMKFIKDFFDVVQRIRAQGVPAQLGNLPGRQVLEYPPDFMTAF